jgi:hypothetical protein
MAGAWVLVLEYLSFDPDAWFEIDAAMATLLRLVVLQWALRLSTWKIDDGGFTCWRLRVPPAAPAISPRPSGRVAPSRSMHTLA